MLIPAGDFDAVVPQLAEDKAEALSEMLRLMGEPNRLRIIVACLQEPRAVGEMATALGMTPSLTSHHLRLLKAARLVKAEKRGKQVFYVAADNHVRHVVGDLLDHINEDWT
jgi:DNA-binding transcriptional ArsR family regulator